MYPCVNVLVSTCIWLCIHVIMYPHAHGCGYMCDIWLCTACIAQNMVKHCGPVCRVWLWAIGQCRDFAMGQCAESLITLALHELHLDLATSIKGVCVCVYKTKCHYQGPYQPCLKPFLASKKVIPYCVPPCRRRSNSNILVNSRSYSK